MQNDVLEPPIVLERLTDCHPLPLVGAVAQTSEARALTTAARPKTSWGSWK